MNVVSNFIGSISPNMFGGGSNGITQNIDLGDTTFAKLLEKQMNNGLQEQTQDFMNGVGLPPEIYFENTDNLNSSIKTGENSNMSEAIKPINENNSSDFSGFKNTKDMSSSEVVTFFNSLFDSKPSITDTTTTDFFEFEKKMAAGEYNRYARNIVTDINEFVSDTMKMKLEP